MTGRDDHPRRTKQGSNKKRWKKFKSSVIMEFQEANPVDSPRKNGLVAFIMAILIMASVLLIIIFISGGEFCFQKMSY